MNQETNETIEEQIAESFEMEDSLYIEMLEKELCDSIRQNVVFKEAIHSFVELLEFINTNFGETADFPVRIDSDFYKEQFIGILAKTQGLVEEVSAIKVDPLELIDPIF
jgi:hypothetical protein